ncbi:MAG: GDP-mannose 4,6-dehydratase [Candidatus Odinarchaeota archaeon]
MSVSLITGIGGFVASHMADLLLSKGETVIGTYRWNEDLSRIEHIKDKITMVPMDLLDYSSIYKVLKYHVDSIYHLAAQSYVPDSFYYPALTIEINTVGTVNLLEVVRNIRDEISNWPRIFDPVIHICSSSEVYGQVNPDEVPIKETQPFRPQNPYAIGKVGADMAAYTYFRNYGLKTIRTRMFTHTGPRRTMASAESSFAMQIARIEANLQEPVVKHGNLESIRTIADVRDACRAYYELVNKCGPGEVYNIGGDKTLSIGEILDYLISLSSVKIRKELDPALLRPSDVTLQIPDCTKFKAATDWKPEIPFEKTMLDLLDWWRSAINQQNTL